MSAVIEQRNQDATIYVGNLDEKLGEELLWELMLQVGPVVNVHMPKDKVTGKYIGYGFVEFRSEEDADYALRVTNMIKIYSKAIKVNKASSDKKNSEVGANIFLGNLDPEVDEKLIYDTFAAFGTILDTPKVMRDQDTSNSKGYGFIAYDNFESSDLAIEVMNGQYLANRPIVVQYAFKKDTPGERHGSQAERILAASQPRGIKPHSIFASATGETQPPQVPHPSPMFNPMMGMQQQPMMMQSSMMNLPMYMTPQMQPQYMQQQQHQQPPPPPMSVMPPPPPLSFSRPPPPPTN
jgi:splicing factor 3B subunit 4